MATALDIDVRSQDDTHRAIVARIERRVNDGTTVPQFMQAMIDQVVNDINHLVLACMPGDENRFSRLHAYYAEFMARISSDPSVREEATRQFDEYFACMIRGAQSTRYSIWTDGVEVYAA